MRRIVIISLLFVLLLTTVSAFTRRDSDCSSCHSSPNPDAGYIYSTPVMILGVPLFVDPEKEFTIEIKIDFSDYEIENMILSVSEDRQIISFEESVIEASSVKKSDTFSFTATAMEKGVTRISVTAEILLHYDHPAGDADDRRTEMIERSATLTVGSTTLMPSAWSVLLDENGEKITLTATSDITDIEITPPNSVEAVPRRKSSLDANDELVVTLRPLINNRIEDNTIISWKQNGTPYAMAIGTVYNPTITGKTDYFSWAGRITGISSIILLLCSLVLGGIWNTGKFMNRKIKTKTRIRYHCAVSWFLFSIALYHGVALLIGPYSRRLWNPWIILGEASAVSMLLVSLTGSFMKFSIRILGAKTWRRLHLYGTLAALVLGTIHGIRIGTDLSFIRESAYLGKIVLAVLILMTGTAITMNLVTGRKRKKAAEREASFTAEQEMVGDGTRFQFHIEPQAGGKDEFYHFHGESEDHYPSTAGEAAYGHEEDDGYYQDDPGEEFSSEFFDDDYREDYDEGIREADGKMKEDYYGEWSSDEGKEDRGKSDESRVRKGRYGTGTMLDWDTKGWREGGRYRRDDERYMEPGEEKTDDGNDDDDDDDEDLVEYDDEIREADEFWADLPATRKNDQDQDRMK